MAGGSLWEMFQKVLKCMPKQSKQSRLDTILWYEVIRRGGTRLIKNSHEVIGLPILDSCSRPGSQRSFPYSFPI